MLYYVSENSTLVLFKPGCPVLGAPVAVAIAIGRGSVGLIHLRFQVT